MLSSMVLAALAPFTLALPSAGLPARASNLGNWDISTVAAGIPSGGYQRNLTSIYTYNGASESIWLITHCIRQGGPGFEEVDFCDNPDFSWTVEGEADLTVRQRIVFKDQGPTQLVGSGALNEIGRVLIEAEADDELAS